MIRNGKVARSRIAIVTPWFGRELRGGAEQQAWQLSEHLAERGHAVDVLTTCCPSFYHDWERNSLRAGIELSDTITIRRFKADKRDRRAFERVNAILLGADIGRLHRLVSPVGDADAEAFCRNGINSTALNAYLASDGGSYDRIVFIPYMFGTTLFGLPAVAGRAYLQPCLHREPYAYLARVAACVYAAKGLIFNSEGERDVALSLYGPGIGAKSFVVGEGIDAFDSLPQAASIGEFAPNRERYVLYLGRQDPAKNVSTLVTAFKNFRRSAPASRLKLVLAGERNASYGDSHLGIVDVGPVSDSEKTALLAHCRALAQPSVNESFSRVMYEAWMFGRPVLVNGACAPTANAVGRCGGGYVADSMTSWEHVLHRIASESEETLAELGERGRAYAVEVTPWASVIRRYEAMFAADPAEISTDRFDHMPDLPLRAALADGKVNVVFAGPVATAGHIERLLVVFLHLLTIEREARLVVAATEGTDSGAFEDVQAEVRRLNLVDRFLLARDLAAPQLQAIYLGADVFVTLDTDSGGCSELRDAIAFDIPVVTIATPEHRAMAGDASILIDEASDALSIAVLLDLVAKDAGLREAVAGGRRRSTARTSMSTSSRER